MPITKSNNAGNSGAEEQFVQLFGDTFGAEKDISCGAEWDLNS